MDFSNPSADILEGFTQPQGTDNMIGDIVPPQTADNNTDFAGSKEKDINSMTDEEFAAHISEIKNGTAGRKFAGNTQNPESDTDDIAKKTQEPFRSFATKEEFDGFMKKTIGERLKGGREDKKRLDGITRRAQSIYGGTAEEAIDKMFSDAETRFADELGKSLEEYREDISIKQDASAYRSQIEEQKRYQQAVDAQVQQWETESEQLKTVIPDFDFKQAMENDVFKSAVLEQGMSLASAYIYTTRTLQKPMEKRQEVYEVGNTRTRATPQGAVSPMDMSDEEFAKYIAGIRNR